jgi:YgiT-type zinc finger domain-containing protein
MRDRLCALCGGTVAERRELLARKLPGGDTVLLENAPVRVCQECGHRWFTHATMTRVESLTEGRREPQEVRQVPVYSFGGV